MKMDDRKVLIPDNSEVELMFYYTKSF